MVYGDAKRPAFQEVEDMVEVDVSSEGEPSGTHKDGLCLPVSPVPRLQA